MASNFQQIEAKARRDFVMTCLAAKVPMYSDPSTHKRVEEQVEKILFAHFAKAGMHRVSTAYVDFHRDKYVWDKMHSDRTVFPFLYTRGPEQRFSGGPDWRDGDHYEPYAAFLETENITEDMLWDSFIAKGRDHDNKVAEEWAKLDSLGISDRVGMDVWPRGEPITPGLGQDQHKLGELWNEVFGKKQPLFEGLEYFEAPVIKKAEHLVTAEDLDKLRSFTGAAVRVELCLVPEGYQAPAVKVLRDVFMDNCLYEESILELFLVAWGCIVKWVDTCLSDAHGVHSGLRLSLWFLEIYETAKKMFRAIQEKYGVEAKWATYISDADSKGMEGKMGKMTT